MCEVKLNSYLFLVNTRISIPIFEGRDTIGTQKSSFSPHSVFYPPKAILSKYHERLSSWTLIFTSNIITDAQIYTPPCVIKNCSKTFKSYFTVNFFQFLYYKLRNLLWRMGTIKLLHFLTSTTIKAILCVIVRMKVFKNEYGSLVGT